MLPSLRSSNTSLARDASASALTIADLYERTPRSSCAALFNLDTMYSCTASLLACKRKSVSSNSDGLDMFSPVVWNVKKTNDCPGCSSTGTYLVSIPRTAVTVKLDEKVRLWITAFCNASGPRVTQSGFVNWVLTLAMEHFDLTPAAFQGNSGNSGTPQITNTSSMGATQVVVQPRCLKAPIGCDDQLAPDPLSTCGGEPLERSGRTVLGDTRPPAERLTPPNLSNELTHSNTTMPLVTQGDVKGKPCRGHVASGSSLSTAARQMAAPKSAITRRGHRRKDGAA